MNDYMLEDLYPGQDVEPSWLNVHEGQFSPRAWEHLETRAHWETRTEPLWEWGFVVATLSLVGWYLYWLFAALQSLTIVP